MSDVVRLSRSVAVELREKDAGDLIAKVSFVTCPFRQESDTGESAFVIR